MDFSRSGSTGIGVQIIRYAHKSTFDLKMLLAYSTNAFTKTDLSTALTEISDLGYAGAEILCERPHWYPDDIDERQLQMVKELLQQKGLGVSNLNANTANSFFTSPPPENVFEPSLTNRKPEIRRAREAIVIKAIHMAHSIGAKCISLTSGRPTPGCFPDDAVGYFIESLSRICEAAHQYNVAVGIEYEPGLLVENAYEVLDVIDRVDSDLLGVNLDIGHSYLNGEEPEVTIEALKGRIWNIHIEDIKNMKHFHLVPGDGDMPFKRYLKALKKIGYQGYLTAELYSFPQCPVEVGRRSYQYLANLLAELECNDY
ncbi:MAG: sugar phosphate isomerase/epimerase [Methylomonas sp.]|jgi:sugar phosphate isomerase/epimerase|uniref:sugar phosphate isomerase/epimerase family protein n=1 Tax=Methylomonas sp. TaxID=418 RepID=UPI0025DC5B2A|nr:sugar phosphate isomerase/epimerase [Methylomonas sp.]MCK9607070.1 sugar phosphate isomerase/epimerase [Methylomonas sp.]